eukprot:COSAG02_NODE_809_length_16922_cov_11.295013_5_plen_49_part_00
MLHAIILPSLASFLLSSPLRCVGSPTFLIIISCELSLSLPFVRRAAGR